MRMTAASDGAFRILMAVAAQEREAVALTMPEMAIRLGLAEPLVVKTCHRLMQAGFLRGRRGRGGGYRLGAPARTIAVLAVVDLFEAAGEIFPCRPGEPGGCRIVAVCRLRGACDAAYAAFRAELAPLTLADLAPDLKAVALEPVTTEKALASAPA